MKNPIDIIIVNDANTEIRAFISKQYEWQQRVMYTICVIVDQSLFYAMVTSKSQITKCVN